MKSKILEAMEPVLSSKSIIYVVCFGDMNSEYPVYSKPKEVAEDTEYYVIKLNLPWVEIWSRLLIYNFIAFIFTTVNLSLLYSAYHTVGTQKLLLNE